MASASKTTSVSAPSPPKLVGSSESEDRGASKSALESVMRPVDSLPDTAKKPANKGI